MTATLAVADFWRVVKAHGIGLFSGVPCSLLEEVLEHCFQDPQVKYVPAPREDAALGVASGAYLVGETGGILIQNSGLGNIVNGLTSFNLLYRVPVFMVISWRGYEGQDAPEHLIMGAKTIDFLRAMEVHTQVLGESGSPEQEIVDIIGCMRQQRLPVALIVRPGVICA